MAALLLAAVATLVGTLASYGYDRNSPGYARLAMGCLVGMTTLAFGGFVLPVGLGTGPATLVGAAIVTMLPAELLRDAAVRATMRRDVGEIADRLAWTVRWPTVGTLVAAVYGLAIAPDGGNRAAPLRGPEVLTR